MIAVTPATLVHNAQVLDAVPADARKIVEIGTGSGALAREIKAKCPQAEYVGVEISETYAEMGRPYCARMYIENFENATGELLRELMTADVVIFADVLEHFVDPWVALKRMANWLKSGAGVIACIPNIQHWSIQYRLLAGDFRYADTGLLDRTHLRFFTRQTVLELFQSTGYDLLSIAPRIFDFPNQEVMLGQIAVTARAHGMDVAQCVQDAAAFQYVVVARPLESLEV